MTFQARDWGAEKRLWNDGPPDRFADPGRFTLKSAARQYESPEEGLTPALPAEGFHSSAGSRNILGGTLAAHDVETAFAGDSLNQKAELIAAKTMADAQKEAADREREGQQQGSIWSTVGSIAGAGLGLLFCDERCKVDIADLNYEGATDPLAKLAYDVKWLREHA